MHVLRRRSGAAMLVGVGLAAGAFSGCSSSTTDSGLTESELPSAFAHAVCDQLGPCCQQGGYSYDAVKCRAALEASFAFRPKQTRYDASAAARCVEAAKKQTAACVVAPDPALAALAAACDQIYVGTRAPGASCDSTQACAPAPENADVACEPAGDPAATCQVHPHGVAGDSCALPDGVVCSSADGLRCSSQSICVALDAIGAPCSASEPCVDGAYCDGATCQPVLPLDAPCADWAQCESGKCNGKCYAPTVASADLCAGNLSYDCPTEPGAAVAPRIPPSVELCS